MKPNKQSFEKMSPAVKRSIIVAAIIVILLLLALIIIDIWEKRHSEFEGEADDSFLFVELDGKYYERRSNVDAILIAGLDKFDSYVSSESYNNDRQADFLLLMIVDHDNKTCSAVHINRDTVAELTVLGVGGSKAGTVSGQIALSHSFGKGGADSGRNLSRDVSKLLGINIDNYATLTMDAVATLNDLAGGVTLTVKDDFSGVDDTLVKGQTVKLMGEHALNYVRARAGLADSSNVARMERQRQYLTELYKVVLDAMRADEGFGDEAVLKMADHLVSDFSTDAIDELFDALGEYDFGEIYTLDGELRQGEQYMEFYLDREAVTKLMVELMYKEKK